MMPPSRANLSSAADSRPLPGAEQPLDDATNAILARLLPIAGDATRTRLLVELEWRNGLLGVLLQREARKFGRWKPLGPTHWMPLSRSTSGTLAFLLSVATHGLKVDILALDAESARAR